MLAVNMLKSIAVSNIQHAICTGIRLAALIDFKLNTEVTIVVAVEMRFRLVEVFVDRMALAVTHITVMAIWLVIVFRSKVCAVVMNEPAAMRAGVVIVVITALT